MTLLRVENLRVAYGHVQSVRGISFDVPDGQIVAMIGSNGAGKTSALNALTGLIPRSGRAEMDGIDLGRLATDEIVRLGVVQVPQGRQLFPDMSVRENLEMGGYLQPAARRQQQYESLMERFPLLRNRAAQKAGTLSGGEQQLLAIARALMATPKVLFLDEPCLGLAPIMVKQVAGVIRELNRQAISILLVEQNFAFALALAHSVIVLQNGQITMSGSAQDIRASSDMRRSYLGI